MKAAGRADAALARLVARRRREILRAGPHARGRPRAVVVARRRRACLCLRRRQAHGQGRRARAGRHRRRARRALDQRGGRLRRRAEEGRAATRRTCIDPMHAPVPLPPVTRTTCPYCGVGCGVSARPDGIGGAITTGDPDHPANFGRLCSKGFALDETLGLERPPAASDAAARRRQPRARRLGHRARRPSPTAFAASIERDGPDAVAFYLSGQLLTEDYYVANKLMKGFLGSANVDTNSRLCMASSVAGHRRAFGEDVVPGCYEDLDEADLLVLVGSNAAWCHPVLYQRMTQQPARARRQDRGDRSAPHRDRRRGRPVSARSRRAPTPRCSPACWSISRTSARSTEPISTRTRRALTLRSRAPERSRRTPPPPPRATGLDEGDVARFFQLFRANERAVTCFSQGVNQSAQGTDKVNAIINCHLATGRIGKPGMGPFSLTGQPNAMGGREVGGLANQLAAHMGFARRDVDRVRRFWNAPHMAEREGLKAVQMFEAIERGEIKALWVMATNPGVSLPRAGAVREALKKLELFVVSENVLTNDTVSAHAARAASRRGLGREGRHRHQLRAAHLAPARLPAAAGRGPAGLVDRLRGRAASGPWRRVRLSQRRRRVPRARGAVGLRERRRARVRSRRARGALGRGLRRARAGAMAGARRSRPTPRACSPTAASARRTARPVSSRRSRRRCARRPAPNFRCASTPAACATSGTA